MLFIGEGLFSLITEEGVGEKIFSLLTKRFDELRRSGTTSSSSSCASSNEDSDYEVQDAPALPPRNYKQDTIKSLLNKRSAVRNSPKLKPKAKATRSLTQDGCYDEVHIEEAKTEAKKSPVTPAFINSLIKKHKATLNQASRQAADDNDNLYHVLDDFRKKIPTEDHYALYSLPEH